MARQSKLTREQRIERLIEEGDPIASVALFEEMRKGSGASRIAALTLYYKVTLPEAKTASTTTVVAVGAGASQLQAIAAKAQAHLPSPLSKTDVTDATFSRVETLGEGVNSEE